MLLYLYFLTSLKKIYQLIFLVMKIPEMEGNLGMVKIVFNIVMVRKNMCKPPFFEEVQFFLKSCIFFI